MCPAVCFQVGALRVDFVAAGEVAAVDSFFRRVGRLGRERMLRDRTDDYRRVVQPAERHGEQRLKETLLDVD